MNTNTKSLIENAIALRSTVAATPRRVVRTPEEREEIKRKLEQERAARKAERDKKKAEREAERANRKPHESKLSKLEAQLPSLSAEAKELVTNLLNEVSFTELPVIVSHLELAYRRHQVTAASEVELKEGDDVVVVTSADPRLIGMSGYVTKVNRIRAYVQLDGFDKPSYFFTSDLALASEGDEEDEGDEIDEEELVLEPTGT